MLLLILLLLPGGVGLALLRLVLLGFLSSFLLHGPLPSPRLSRPGGEIEVAIDARHG